MPTCCISHATVQADVVPGAKKKKLGWSTYDDDDEDDEGTCAKTCK